MEKFVRYAGLSALGLLLLAGCKEEKPASAPPRPARIIEVEPHETVFSVQASGKIQARYVSNVGFLVSGRMISRNVDVGAVVASGTLLAAIDDVDYSNKLIAARSQVSAAQADLAQAGPQEERFRKLLSEGFATQANYDRALKELDNAKAALVAAQANQRLAEDSLRYTKLVAPTEGAVTEVGANVGQVVTPGQMVIQISKMDDKDAVFAASARTAAGATVGRKVKVALQDNPSIEVDGTIREISPSADPTTGTYTLKVSVPDAPESMRLGAIVVGRGEIVSPDSNIVTLPPQALLQTGTTPQVWVVGADDLVQKRAITVARYDANQVVVERGLVKGDRVVIAGVNTLAEGQKVVPQTQPAETK